MNGTNGNNRKSFGFWTALALTLAVLGFAAAPFAGATVYATQNGRGELSLSVGDSVIVDSHKIVLKDVSVMMPYGSNNVSVMMPYGSNRNAVAVFDVYDTAGNKIQTIALTDPNSAYPNSASSTTAAAFNAPTFSVKVSEIEGSGTTKVIVALPASAVAADAANGKSGGKGGGQSVYAANATRADVAADVANAAVASEGAEAQVTDSETAFPMAPSDAGVSEFEIKINPGWNMISSPCSNGADSAASCTYTTNCVKKESDAQRLKLWNYNALSGKHDSPGFIEYASGIDASDPNSEQKQAVQTVFWTAGVGYWVNARSACKITVRSAGYDIAGKQLYAGWNQIGASSFPQRFEEVKGNCVAASGPWYYDAAAGAAGRYVKAQALEPGKGYFLRVAADCVLGPAESSIPPLPE